MVKTFLVEKDFNEGEALIKELDEANFDVHAALWLYESESEYWRLIIASEVVDTHGARKAYEQINDIINQSGDLKSINLMDITAWSPKHPLIKSLRSVIQTSPKEITDIRFSRKTIDNTFIDDAYIYRMQ
ncbi:hypothetical protein [Bacillus sinesaloumensis]|uniref:hypothetical protein n=1 Tax=Litchfieldia sinesaloumensis TaxID=1926280 RepID=UPI00098844E0|nr:hypothetical protein [Bacillus sinesaloumensis]